MKTILTFLLLIIIQLNSLCQIKVTDSLCRTFISQPMYMNKITKVLEDSLFKEKILISYDSYNNLKNVLRFLNQRFKTTVFSKFNSCSFSEVHFNKIKNSENSFVFDSNKFIQMFEINYANTLFLNNAIYTINKQMKLETFYGFESHLLAEVAFFKKKNNLIIVWTEFNSFYEFYDLINYLKKDFTLFCKELDDKY
jgi:hypothetical protein